MVGDFIDRFRDFDLIVMSNNFIHPELLVHELKRPIKILGFFDDPHSTYMRGIQYLWAFDGAFYISPSYNERSLFHEAKPYSRASRVCASCSGTLAAC